MKKLIILLFSIFLMSLKVQASVNMLHSIVLEGTEDGYNVVLKTDSMPDVKKVVKGSNNLILDVKNVTPSNSVSAIYKSTTDIKSLIIENVSKNELKIYIQANGISNATIMASSSDNMPVILSERFPLEKVIWSIAVLGILAILVKSAKAITDYENSLVIKRDIKAREIELYKNFQRELSKMPKINGRINSAYATNIMPKSRRNYKELARR